MSRWAAALALAPAVALAAGTRLPAAGGMQAAAILAATAACIGLGVALLRQEPRGWVATALTACLLALLLVPPAAGAWLAALPAWLAPLAVLLCLHLLHAPPAAAERDGAEGPGWTTRLARHAPFALLAVGLAVLHGSLGLAPATTAATRELHGPGGILLLAILLAAPVVALCWLRDAIQPPPRAQRTAAASPTGAGSPLTEDEGPDGPGNPPEASSGRA